jgi:PAS domain S-box-containing protein
MADEFSMDDAASDRRMRATFDSSPIGLALIDVDGGVIRANAALRELTGQFEAKGRRLFEDPFDIERLCVPQAQLQEVFEGKRPWIIDRFSLRRERGEDVWLEVSVYPVQDADGRRLCATLILENITAEVHAAEEVQRRERTNRTLLRTIPGLLFHVSADGTFLSYSPGSEAHTLVNADEIVGSTIDEVLPEPERQQSMDCLRRALQSRDVIHQNLALWFDAELRHLEARYAAVTDDEALIIVRDVTDQRWREIGRAALHAISELFDRAEDVESVYREAPAILAEQFGFPIAAIELYDAVSTSMLLLGSHGIPDDGAAHRVPCDETVSGTVAHTGKPFVAADVTTLPSDMPSALLTPRTRGLICVAMPGDGGPLGTVCLADTRPREACPTLTDALVSVANYLGESIARRQARSDLRAVVSAARCLLWEADVSLRSAEGFPDGVLFWDTGPLDEESAQRFLPLDVPAGYTYVDAWLAARSVQDTARLDATGEAALRENAPGYSQAFSCADRHGVERWIQEDVFIRRLSPGRWHCVGVCTDITERKRVEQAKDEFMASVSHELRTPLTSIKGALELLVEGSAGGVTDQAQSLLEIALNNTERLTRLVNDVLDISTLESHGATFEMASMELAPLIAESLDANRPFVDKLGVELVFQGAIPGVIVSADGGRFVQLMTNLVVNAAKFSPPQGRVTVTMDVHDGWARVSVRDGGPGIPESARATLFDRFTQVDSSNTRGHDGTGLGLAIARGIVERMGGRIDLTSEVGVGSTFFFDLPIRDA